MGLVLGIESSCDETAAAVVRDGRDVLSSIVASQAALHAPFRGVVPEIASRSHLREIVPTIEEALEQARISPRELTGVAATYQPGLVGSLLVGASAAKAFAWLHELPIVAVDHIAAHLYAALMEGAPAQLPALALVASGGHTALYYYKNPLDFEMLGCTNDDAAGEAFDKVAAILGLGYPGGPAIEKVAFGVDPKPAAIAVPRVSSGPFDFSFSGLKTAVRYRVLPPGAKEKRTLTEIEIATLAAGFQHAAVEHMTLITMAAARARGAKTILVGGGVACNDLLRRRLASACTLEGLDLRIPRPALCADNAAMVAGLGSAMLDAGRRDDLGFPVFPNGVPQAHSSPQAASEVRRP